MDKDVRFCEFERAKVSERRASCSFVDQGLRRMASCWGSIAAEGCYSENEARGGEKHSSERPAGFF